MNIFRCHERDCILNAGADVIDAEVGVVVANDPLERNSVQHELENVLDGDACSRDVRFAEMNLGIYGDSVNHIWCS